MSYTPNTWESGDVITSAKLNNIEQGIANAGSGGILVAHIDEATMTLDKTWQQINDADLAVIKLEFSDAPDDISTAMIVETLIDNGDYLVNISGGAIQFITDSADGYPHANVG